MGIKPITLRRDECIHAICDAINASGLPAFVIVDLLDRIILEERKMANAEYQRDLQNYHKKEGTVNGKEKDT